MGAESWRVADQGVLAAVWAAESRGGGAADHEAGEDQMGGQWWKLSDRERTSTLSPTLACPKVVPWGG